jgi:cobyrinic acid a,c-diamide synthase
MNAAMIAGTASGVGKTTVALAVMAGLRSRGVVVQPFKCGPDFIDGGHHSAICGRTSRNLDSWMLSGDANRHIFLRASAGASFSLVEGVMGLFDGVAGSGEEGSSAEIAKFLGLPVILVLDASASARSLAAVARGFEVFDPSLRLAGFMLNRVAGESHLRLLESAIRSSTTLPILGWLPVEDSIAIPERHLGLHTAVENAGSSRRFEAFAQLAERYFDLDSLSQIGTLISSTDNDVRKSYEAISVRVAVARDESFCFYYEDNLDALRELGAKIVTWSPLRDRELPKGVDALYFGGGYPELYARQLSENQSLLGDLRRFAQAGKPIYAECGGMMYLAEKLDLLDGTSCAMAGVLPLRVATTKRLVHFGYADVEFLEDCLLGEKGTVVRGHSFHCSRVVGDSLTHPAYRVHYSLSGRRLLDGYSEGNVLASYIHLHFRSNAGLAQAFLRNAKAAQPLARTAS